MFYLLYFSLYHLTLAGCCGRRGVPPSDARHRKEGGVGERFLRWFLSCSSVISSIGCCLNAALIAAWMLLGCCLDAAWVLLGCCFDCCLVLLVGGDEVCGGLEEVGYDSNFFEKDNDEQ